MENRSMFVGLDVHKETIDVSIAEGERQGEVRHYGVIASDLEPLDKVVRVLRRAGRCILSTKPARVDSGSIVT
jgi:transposase